MKPVNKDVLKLAASKMMFEMSDQEYDALIKELNVFIKQA